MLALSRCEVHLYVIYQGWMVARDCFFNKVCTSKSTKEIRSTLYRKKSSKLLCRISGKTKTTTVTPESGTSKRTDAACCFVCNAQCK